MEGPLIVVGSINMDLVFRVSRLPHPGETLPGKELHRFFGGKGANQAVGLSRLGGDVFLIGALGNDPYGAEIRQGLEKEGINISRVTVQEEHTGLAAIFLDDSGENHIITIAGANSWVSPGQVRAEKELFARAWGVLLQLEIPLDTVQVAARLGREHGCRVFLDPAPVRQLPPEIYRDLDFLLPNRGELQALIPAGAEDRERADLLLDKGLSTLVLTRGQEGSTVFSREGRGDYPAFPVEVVDTTAAGDAFAAALCFFLQQGQSLPGAVKRANAAGALAASQLGAQDSLPTGEAVEKMVQEVDKNEMDY